jgi:hypothetical protein
MKGWVYVITNKAMPGLAKIGYSSKDPQLRAKEFDGTGSPHPYVVEYELLVHDPRDIEQRVHKTLGNCREGKEWFRCSIFCAVEAIRTVAGDAKLLEGNFRIGAIYEAIHEAPDQVSFDVRKAVASDPNCPSDVLEALVRLPPDFSPTEPDLLKIIANNPACPADLFYEFDEWDCPDEKLHWELLEILASNPSCPQPFFERLIYHDEYIEDDKIIQALACNPNCSSKNLAWIAWELPKSLATDFAKSNPSWSDEEFRRTIDEQLASGDFLIQSFAAERDDCPPDVLENLASTDDFEVLRYIARNPATPEHVLISLSGSDELAPEEIQNAEYQIPDENYGGFGDIDGSDLRYQYVIYSALANPSNPLTQASRSQTSAARLEVLASCPSRWVRKLVAVNERAAEETLLVLARDTETEVRVQIARNCRCTPDVFRKLSLDKNPEVLCSVAENKMCPPDVLERLATDPSIEIRQAVVVHEHCPPSAFVIFASDPSPMIRKLALERATEEFNKLVEGSNETTVEGHQSIAGNRQGVPANAGTQRSQPVVNEPEKPKLQLRMSPEMEKKLGLQKRK